MESKNSIRKVYEDLYHVSLGPWARQLESRTLASAATTLLETIKYTGKTLRDLVLYRGKTLVDHPLIPSNDIWLMVGTTNNHYSLRFLEKDLDRSQVVIFAKANRRLGPYPRLNLAPQGWYWWKALWLLPALWPRFGSMLLWNFHTFLQGLGTFETARAILSRECPRALIFANDHSAPIRAFARAAIDLGIPTVYLQHASVSNLFPPLLFDLSLLEGKVAWDIYRACGPIRGEVALVGMPKLDAYLSQRNFRPTIERIGLCTNMLDEPDRIEALLRRLTKAFPRMRISYRPHPRDTRRPRLPAAVHLSDSQAEGIFEFLQQQDLLIAGDTSTHLEAVLLNVVSLYFPMNDRVEDYYAYVRHGVVDRFDDPEALIAWIEAHRDRRPEVYRRARPYHALVGTPDEGRSQARSLEVLRKFLDLNPGRTNP